MKLKNLGGAVACTLLLASIGCISKRGLEQGLAYAMQPHAAVVGSAFGYYWEHHRWPKTREDLVDYAAKHTDNKFSNERYEVLDLKEQSDGSLLIHYQLAKPEKGEGTVRITAGGYSSEAH